jgi:hypothetical protein
VSLGARTEGNADLRITGEDDRRLGDLGDRGMLLAPDAKRELVVFGVPWLRHPEVGDSLAVELLLTVEGRTESCLCLFTVNHLKE